MPASARRSIGALDRPAIDAGAAAMMTDATVAVIHDNGISAAADAAFEKAAEEKGRSKSVGQEFCFEESGP